MWLFKQLMCLNAPYLGSLVCRHLAAMCSFLSWLSLSMSPGVHHQPAPWQQVLPLPPCHGHLHPEALCRSPGLQVGFVFLPLTSGITRFGNGGTVRITTFLAAVSPDLKLLTWKFSSTAVGKSCRMSPVAEHGHTGHFSCPSRLQIFLFFFSFFNWHSATTRYQSVVYKNEHKHKHSSS